jgi:hypothetical protein
MYFVVNHGSKRSYFVTYWSLAVIDTVMELGIVYEIASRVFRPVGVGAQDVRGSLMWMVDLSLTVALGLSWLARPPARTWAESIVTKGTLFASALITDLLVLTMALSISARLPWTTHVAKIAQGLDACSLVSLLIEARHSYFGVGREVHAFVFLSRICIAAYITCVAYWAVMLWRKEQPSRETTQEMRERLFTLQRRVEYDLQSLPSRKNL